MPHPEETQSRRDIFTVSRLNSEVRAVLQSSFPLLWVEGEISNLACPRSGHIYFSLKDSQAQVRCAMFRMKRQYLRFQPEDGLKVLIRARPGLYEGRGEFQLVVEHMEPAGEGDLQQAFEALKTKLQAEGLFDTQLKKPLPMLPRRIGIITSPSGAAIRDVLSVLQRRCPAIPVLIYPTQVQGEEAPSSLISALKLAEARQDCDLLILTRGGGSLEDLSAFNDETLARTIHRLSIPLISAVGHEIDFTIADFVADCRAPTPSVAAELAAPDKSELLDKLDSLLKRVLRALQRQLQHDRQSLLNLQRHLRRSHPASVLQQRQQQLDELSLQLFRALRADQSRQQSRLALLASRLHAATPSHRLQRERERLTHCRQRLTQATRGRLQEWKQRLAVCGGTLHALSPLATLERGYSITRRHPDGTILHSADAVSAGDRLETRLANGTIISTVDKK